MRYSNYPEQLQSAKRKFKLYWNDGGQEIIEGRGCNSTDALENAYKRVGYNKDTLKALVYWEEV